MSRRESESIAVRRVALAAVASACLACSFAACGGTDDADEIAKVMSALQDDLAERDVEAVCAALGPKPRYQLGTIGHDRKPTTCERDLRDYVAGMEKAALLANRPMPNLRRTPRPRVARVEVDGDRAVAVTRLTGDRLDIPFVKDDGDWKLGDLFVVTGPVRRDLR